MVMCLFLCVAFVTPALARHLTLSTDRWPPYEDLGNQQAPGFSTEVVRLVLKNMGVEFEFNTYPWPRAIQLAFDGRVDAVFSAFYTEERNVHCHYPREPLVEARYLLFIRKANLSRLRFDSLEDLRGREIGIVRGAAYPKEFMAFVTRHSVCQYVSTEELNFRKLAAGRVDYIVAEHGNGLILIQEMGLKDRIAPILSTEVQKEKIFLIFSRKTISPEFVQRFSEKLRNFKATKTYHLIYRKYFNYPAFAMPK